MAYEIALLIGRVLFGGYFAFSGINHFLNANSLTGWVESKGVPRAELAVYLSGLMLLAGGLGIAAGAYPVISIALVGVFLAVVTPWFHDYWNMEGEDRQSHQTNFLKNMALFGALLVMLSINWTVYSLGMSL
ncbi:MAG: DoxX family membrane protein [Candidatus Aenigmatarchaeota archaeon]